MSRLVLKGGRLVDPSQGLDGAFDLLIEDGRVAEVAVGLEVDGAEVRRVEGLVVAPGFVDTGVRLGEPGHEYRETLGATLRAAAAGGFTAIAGLASTAPVGDQRATTELLLSEAARHPWARLWPVGAVTRGMAGEELAEIGEMREAGAVAFGDDAWPIDDPAVLRRALLYARHFDALLVERPQDRRLAGEGVMHEGRWSTRLGLPGIPPLAEEVAVARDLLLAEETGGRLHLAPISTGRVVERLRQAKAAGLAVSCAVSVHHLLLSDHHLADSGFSPFFKVLPPLRPAADVEALQAGLADGTVDALRSDHTPYHGDEVEVQFSAAPFGIVGLETAVSLCLDRLVAAGVIGLSRLIELFSTAPARLYGLDAGSLAVGSLADVTLLDLARSVTVEPEKFYGTARNTPFAGWQLRGAPVGTLLAGRPIDLAGP